MSETNTELKNGVDEEVSEDVKVEEEVATFTQEDVDNIVATRLAREAGKVNSLVEKLEESNKALESFKKAAEEASSKYEDIETRLAQADYEKTLLEVALETGVEPKKLDSLKWDSKEDLLSAVSAWKPSGSSSNVFSGKSYFEDEGQTRFANNIIRRYKESDGSF